MLGFSDWSSVTCEAEGQHLQHLWVHDTHRLNTSQCRCHYCECVKRAAKKQELQLSQLTVCEVLCDNDLHTYSHSQSARLLTDDCLLWMQFCEWLQYDTQRVSSFWTKFCGQMEYYWHVGVCWAITAVMSGHRISFMLCGNMSMKSTPPRTFGLYYQRYLLWVCWLFNGSFLETVLPQLLEDVPWLWVGGFGFVTVELQHSMGKMKFTGKWIGLGGFIAWPPWLLDLTLPDFFFSCEDM